ncbi:sugar phosphate nucleotidyltransferase [Candidatus Margulisiibacteriota bacterium]
MKALIMAAGFGTRLQPLTLAVPKPMIPIVNKPVMQYNIELLKKSGIKEMCANIHYFPEQIENYFGNGSHMGIKIRYSFEEELLGTAGGVKRMARDLMDIKETFVVVSSDALTDINIHKLVSHHKKTKALATVALAPVEDPSHFGVVILDKNDKILQFQEKPSKEEALSNLVNAGIYVFEPEILDMIPDGFHDFGKELLPKIVGEKGPIFGYKMIEYWSDTGSIGQLKKTNSDILRGHVRVHIDGKKLTSSTWINKDSNINPSAKFEGGSVYIGHGSVIGKNVEIYGDVVIGDRTIVKDNTIIVDSLVWSDSVIGEGSKVKHSVLGNWCRLEERVQTAEGCVIGNRCKISAGKKLNPNTRLDPDKTL